MTIFYKSFRTCLGFAIEHSQEFHDLTATTLSQDQLLAQAGYHRALLFYLMLEITGRIMHDFFSSRGEGYTDAKDIRDALFEFDGWERSDPIELTKALDETNTIMNVILFLKRGGKMSDLTKASH